jgi:hypothetical protein
MENVMAATTKQPEEKQKPETEPEKMSSRDRLLAALDNLNPLTKEEAEMIRKSITEARERSIGEHLSPRQ